MADPEDIETVGFLLTVAGSAMLGGSVALYADLSVFVVRPVLAFVSAVRSLPPEAYIGLGLLMVIAGFAIGEAAETGGDDD